MNEAVKVGSSGPLFVVARKASQEHLSAEHSSLIAILFSAFALEAWVNDLLTNVRLGGAYWSPAGVESLAKIAEEIDDRTASLDLKVQLVAIALSGQAFDRGQQPFQDFALLIRIRNALVHGRPEHIELKVEPPRKHHSVLEQLAERGLVDLDRKGTIHPLLGGLSHPSVGRWAHSTSVAMAQTIAEMIPDSGLRRAVEISFGKFPPDIQQMVDVRQG